MSRVHMILLWPRWQQWNKYTNAFKEEKWIQKKLSMGMYKPTYVMIEQPGIAHHSSKNTMVPWGNFYHLLLQHKYQFFGACWKSCVDLPWFLPSVAHSWERICTSCSCWDYTLPKRDDFIDSTLVRKIVLLVRTDASHNHFFLVCPPNKNRYMLNAFLSGSWLKQMFFLHFSAGKSRCIGRVFSFCIFYWVKLLNLGVSFVGLFWSDVTHVDKYKKLWGQFIYTLVIVKLCLKFFDNDKITMFVHA